MADTAKRQFMDFIDQTGMSEHRRCSSSGRRG